jgi:hypothetical protein
MAPGAPSLAEQADVLAREWGEFAAGLWVLLAADDLAKVSNTGRAARERRELLKAARKLDKAAAHLAKAHEHAEISRKLDGLAASLKVLSGGGADPPALASAVAAELALAEAFSVVSAEAERVMGEEAGGGHGA